MPYFYLHFAGILSPLGKHISSEALQIQSALWQLYEQRKLISNFCPYTPGEKTIVLLPNIGPAMKHTGYPLPSNVMIQHKR